MGKPVRPPGPGGFMGLQSLAACMRDPLAFWLDLNRGYGPLAYARLAWLDVYMANDPRLVEEVLVERHRECVKDLAALEELVRMVGRGLVTSEGEPWRKRRRLISPALQPRRIRGYLETMAEFAERSFAAYGDGERRDFHADSMRISLAIAAKTLLGFDVGPDADRIGAIMDIAVSYYNERLFPWQRVLPASFPTPAQQRFQGAMRELDAIVFRVVTECRDGGDHLLAQLARARDADGSALSDRELRDEAVTMLVGGHETTALTVTYAACELARSPQLTAELRGQLAGLGADELVRLPLLAAIVKETLRLYPPAHAMTRKVIAPLELGGYAIPSGSVIAVAPYALHRNPDFFPDPDRFEPRRWLDTADPPRGAYLPFGDGPRVCIGGHFAMAQAQILIGTLVRQLDLELASDHRLVLEPVITLRPRGGLPVTIRRRTPAALAQSA
jgi:cytochrome P450